MKSKGVWVDFVMDFFLSTTGICIAMGVTGVIFAPEQRFGYEAFFSPPIFGLLASFLGVVTYSRKELTFKQVVARRALYLLLLEVMVFALNYWNGAYTSGAAVAVAVAASVLVIFITVNLVLWLNDSRSAREFNRELAEFRRRETEKF